MRINLPIASALLLAGLLLGTTPSASAQTTKVKAKPGKGMVIKEETRDGQKTKIKMDEMSAAGRQEEMMANQKMAGQQKAGVMVGGAMMTPDKDIVDNAANSKDHTTLVAAVKAAGLVETLKGTGPYTVFAPTNAAFAKLPAGTVDNLLLAEQKPMLTSVLTYHVIPGALRAADLKDGQVLTTVQGKTLTVMKAGGQVMLRDMKGGTVTVTTPDVISSNGVTHVVDGVLMPGM